MSRSKQLKIQESNTVTFLCISAVYLFFISDAINKTLLFFHFDFNRISIFIKSAYELAFFLIIVIFINKLRSTFLKFFLFTFCTFLGGQFLLSKQVSYEYGFLGNILFFNKYFFIFIIYYASYKIQYVSDKFDKIIQSLEKIFLFNSWAVIAGFIFQINLFKSYVVYRYGFSGFIFAANEATCFFFIMLSYFYYKHFILNIKSKQFFIALIASILLGTKGIYLFLILLFLFHFTYRSNVKKKIMSALVFLAVSALVWVCFITGYSQILFGYFIRAFERYDLLTIMLSGRNILIENKASELLPIWGFMNYLIGGQDVTRHMVEMDVIDLFLFMGVIGCIVLFVLYFITIFKFKLSPFHLFFVCAFLFLAFFGGHFLYSTLNALYICIVCMYFHVSQGKSDKDKSGWTTVFNSAK